MKTASATLEKAPAGALLLEDQAGNPVSVWHPDMEAFDRLSPAIRSFMTEMLNPPPARNVLLCVQQMGASVTLRTLYQIDGEDRIKARAI